MQIAASLTSSLRGLTSIADALPDNFHSEWKRNALRHSFISYRVAALKDVARVSLEARNSPNMIFQHYRELVTEEEANRWFAIQPDASAIVPMPAVAA